MKKIILVVVLALCISPIFSMENYITINMEVPFFFEVSEYYNESQTTMLVGMGINAIDRLYFSDGLGISAHISLVYPFSTTTIIENPHYEIFEAHFYDFPSSIFSFGLGVAYKINSFNIDIGPQIRFLALNNTFADYTNFTMGFYINPSWVINLSRNFFEFGIMTGVDLYSNSNIKLKIDEMELKYSGGYTMFYFSLYFGIGFITGKK